MHETILLLTLDHCAAKYQWGNIDFIKLDAEGEESNILKKGKKFLSAASPLIMYELKHGDKVNLPLINRFRNLGYESYRLLPGLNILVPFNPDEPFDGYLLNLFCCKEDTADILESQQVIVKKWEPFDSPHDLNIVKEHLTNLPFGEHVNFDNLDTNRTSINYFDILTAYILAKSESIDATKRVACLMTALNSIHDMLQQGEHSIERLATFARIAFDAGERSLGVNILTAIINRHLNILDFKISEPFLPALSTYDAIPPNNNINEWLFSSILEQYINKSAFSSYFTQRKTLPLLELLHTLGFMNEAMQRRAEMIKSCFPTSV